MAATAEDDAASSAATTGPAAPQPRTLTLVRANVAALAAVGIVLVAAALLADDGWLTVALAVLAPVAAAAAVIDARTRRIPTALAVACAGVGVVVLGIGAVVDGSPSALVRGLLAGVVVGVVYLALWRFAGLGFGDVRLAAALAIFVGWSGWSTVLAFVVLAHLMVLPVALWRVARGRRGDVAFGPGLVVGLYAAVALAQLTS